MSSKNHFIDIKVTVIANPDGSFTAAYAPEVVTVTDYDTVLNFKLDSHTGSNIKIASVTARQENDQLSHPSISRNGRQVVISDINTLAGKFNLDFAFEENGKQGCTTSPVTALKCADEADNDFPEIENVPPR